MDTDIQFGDVEEAAPQPHLRPDRNKHFAVAACFAPDERDLPIFVDLDVMLDMEDHALSDTTVELGGVMLGGQFEDDEGKPFVVVTDSLRAEHYESTKGSFKFTHDTWAEISRQRDEFPDELQMVGWYHTHPDWGVFLSGMDMFICDNFFNKVLDVALVIDPCRDDRGMFQWTGDPSQRVRRTAGFYLIASRFRQQELQWHAELLEGNSEMARDTRFANFPANSGNYPAPVVNIAEGGRSTWLAVGVLGMLTMQFLFLGLLAWKILLPLPAPEMASHADRELNARQEVLDDLIGRLDVAPDGLIETLTQQKIDAARIQREKDGLDARIEQLEQGQLAAEKRQSEHERAFKLLENDNQRLRTQRSDQKSQIEKLKSRLAAYEPEEGDDAQPAAWNWPWVTTLAVVGVLLLAGLIIAFTLRPESEELRESPGDPEPDEGAAVDPQIVEPPDSDIHPPDQPQP